MSTSIPEFKLERYFSKYEFTTKYLMSSSDCETLSIDELLNFDPESKEKNLSELLQLRLGYTETAGDPKLRSLISQFYQGGPVGITIDNILLGCGAEELIYLFFKSNFKSGDHLFVHYPCYQSLYQVASSSGCDITLWKADYLNHWKLDISFLEENIKDNTKAIVLNTPHNPTGYLMDRDTWNRLIEFARKRNLIVFFDEVFRLLEYDQERLPPGASYYENAVSLGVMSKSLGLAGLRIGWIVTSNKTVYTNMATYKDYTSMCNSGPSELLSTFALQAYDKILQRNLSLIKTNINLLEIFINKWSNLFTWVRPKAGCIGFIFFKHPTLSSYEFCDQVVKNCQVLLIPSNCFEYDNNAMMPGFRIGFGRTNFPEALQVLDTYLITHFN